MKKIFFITSLLALFSHLLLISCSQDDEIYSCDEDIDKWVKENKSFIQTLNRSQWYELSYDVLHASYIAFTQSQKIEFWKEKFEEVKMLDWSKDELDHIQKAEDNIMNNRQYFRDDKLSDKELDEIESFYVKWMKAGEKNFGWTKQTAMAIVGTGYKMLDKEGNLLIPQRKDNIMSVPFMRTAKEVDCNCNIGSVFTCFADPLGSCEVSKSGCSASVRGCGVMWVSPCNGTCGGI
ncbi:MAG: bacteriocin fulvocin C-related protein [Bacteroidaceae bacterium]|nr:bacteriocin fulvocin C-related protein [Bacteroidaceae bacterium]